MARPRKQTVDYFPHLCSHKKTLYILEQRYGNDGYAFWFKLLEMLGQTDGHYIDVNNEATWEFLQAKTRQNPVICEEILILLAKLDAIDKELWESRIIWSQNFVDGIVDAYRNRRVDLPVRPSFYCKKPRDIGVSEINLTSEIHKLEETKLEETKLEGTGNNENTRRLYSILEATKGFPVYSVVSACKLDEVMADYNGLNYRLEFKKFQEYWNTRKVKRPWLALRNWLGRAEENKHGKTKHSRDLPKTYTPTRDYGD